ncbi:atp-binding cassette superfamily [Plasmopara halstedii]|uniref:Atp-binding cassette superfamily n=1 Tax=Plasmopara halstedii TaxID=4781 RepID=A0A0P1AM21_PLAHL|nr:atp-binding cassette superfamily [Plasmopara halstedii]CEG42389.1 atp-binding cassette superfamily [Plasmopara halstedii]|eukprot:XP_024578758.1 atp-binding cassette superfamily [Plasmopara halstedii]
MTRFSPAILLASSSLLIDPVLSHEAYATKVPNGANVDGVKAIGHTNPDGGGIRNAFGRDFYSAGHTWTSELCMNDSDDDGQTNGEELGDPCCDWTSESAKDPLWSSGVSNPGDDASISNKTLWPTYKCSPPATNSSGSQTGIQSTESSSDSDSTASTSKAAWNGLALTTTAGLLTLTAAIVL